MLWYSLEAPHRGVSTEYPQHMFYHGIRIKVKKDFLWKQRTHKVTKIEDSV